MRVEQSLRLTRMRWQLIWRNERTVSWGEREEIIHRVSLIALAISFAFDRCELGSRGLHVYRV